MGFEILDTLCRKSASVSLYKLQYNKPEGATAILLRWLLLTRLETRTKESNTCASVRVNETHTHNESKYKM